MEALLGICTLIAAIVGPLAGVAMANSFSRNESKRREAAELFRRLSSDAQTYRFLLIEQHEFRRQLATARQHRMLISLVPADKRTITLEFAENQQLQAQSELNRSVREAAAMASLLNTDVLALALLFGENSSRPCGRAVRDLIAMQDIFNAEALPPLDAVQQRLNDLIGSISQGMKQLYERLTRSLADDELYTVSEMLRGINGESKT